MPKFKNPMKVITGPRTRWSYVHAWSPSAINGQNPKYSVCLLIPKDDKETVDKIKAAIKAAYQEGASKLKGNGRTVPPLEALKNPLRDGDLERPEDPAYENAYFINASSKTKPGLVKKGTISKFAEITDENELYSGCYGFVSVNFYPFSTQGNKGIGAGLNNVLKSRDGDYLGGRVSADTDFDGIDLGDMGDDDVF